MRGTTTSEPDGGRRTRSRGLVQRFRDVGVMVKILSAVAVLGLVAVVLGVSGLTSLATSRDDAMVIYHDDLRQVMVLSSMRAAVLTARIDVHKHALATTAADKSRFEAKLVKDDAAVDANVATYRTLAVDPPEVALIDEMGTAWTAYRDGRTKILLPLGRANDYAAWTKTADTTLVPLSAKVSDTLDRLVTDKDKDAAVAVARAQAGYESSRNLALVLLVLGLTAGLALGVVAARSVARPLRQVSDVLDAMAGGDLTQRLELNRRDEVGQMAANLNRASDQMRTFVSTVNDSAGTLAAASQELSVISEQVSGSAHSVASRADSVSASATQITNTVTVTASAAEELDASIREIARSAAEAAQVGTSAVAQAAETTETIDRLGRSSATIGDVVATITSIAQQTNLLALNATIEAARAGEAGKGFAVVASEVKDLAQQAARASEDVVARVRAIQADTAGAVESIAQIATTIGSINDHQGTIASAVEEQSATTAEIRRTVHEAAAGSQEIASTIAKVAAAASANTEGIAEAARSSTELATMAVTLSELAATYRV